MSPNISIKELEVMMRKQHEQMEELESLRPAAREVGHGGYANQAVQYGDAAVRRLTPVECERLQGLPDDWTRIPDDAPDSRRYAGLGDAVTAPVGEWIGRRIVAVEARYALEAAA